ncbi:carboxypeptidase Y-deficient, partial [Nowakowskiella sp. JEL0078]
LNSKRIKTLPTNTSYQQRFQSNIYLAATQFLQSHMFTLQLLPNVSTKEKKLPSPVIPRSTGKIELSTPLTLNHPEDLIPMGGSTFKPKSQQEAQELLFVLDEQKAQVEMFLQDATRRRKFEDAKSLQRALADLEFEIQNLKPFS